MAYSAAFLRHAFRGRLAYTVEGPAIRVANETPGEPLAGTLELYYDRPDGTRTRLAAWTRTLAPGEDSGLLAAPPLPQGLPPETPCVLVFRGALGDEGDAVAAQVGGCVLASTGDGGGGGSGGGDGGGGGGGSCTNYTMMCPVWYNIPPVLVTQCVPNGQDPAGYFNYSLPATLKCWWP